MIARRHLLLVLGTAAATLIATSSIAAEPPRPGTGIPACYQPLGATERNKLSVAQAFDRWAAGGTSFFEDVLAPDALWVIEGSGPSAGTYRGRDAFLERAVRPFAGRLTEPVRPTMRRVWADGDHVIVHWEGDGVARDLKPYKNRYAWIFRMQDGKAVEVNAFLDLPAYDDVLRRVPAASDSGGDQ